MEAPSTDDIATDSSALTAKSNPKSLPAGNYDLEPEPIVAMTSSFLTDVFNCVVAPVWYHHTIDVYCHMYIYIYNLTVNVGPKLSLASVKR